MDQGNATILSGGGSRVTLTEDAAWTQVEHDSAIGAARRGASALARRLGLGERRAAEVAIAVTELASNLIKHAGGGAILLRACRSGEEAGVEVVAIDRGPGMRDVRASMADGHSTVGTLGIGLGALDRLASGWDVFSAPGRGTVIAASFGLCGTVEAPGGSLRAAGLTRAMTGESVCGDGYALRLDDGILSGVLVDGLGHGPLAASATDAAQRAFRSAAFGSPVELLSVVHRALQGTRGAAVSVVQLSGPMVRYAGVGNVSGVILDGEHRRGMLGHPGIAGSNARVLREHAYDLPVGGVVVLHSDGLTDRLAVTDGPRLLARDPLVVAATLLRDFGLRHDDASVLVVAGAA